MSDIVKSMTRMSGLAKITGRKYGPDKAPPTPVMPDEVEQQRKARLDAAKRAKRGGRASTILAEPPSDVYGS